MLSFLHIYVELNSVKEVKSSGISIKKIPLQLLKRDLYLNNYSLIIFVL